MRKTPTRSQGARAVEVARAAGVSTATVSRTFNEPEKVAPDLRERVTLAAASLGWIPHGAGSALARRRTFIAGALIPTLANGIFSAHINAMQHVFSNAGMTLVIGVTNHDPQITLTNVRGMIARGVEALALVGEADGQEVYDLIQARHIPYVLTHGYRSDSPHYTIGCDNYRVFYTLTERLLALGHRRFGVITPPRWFNDRVAARVEGIKDALAEAGVGLRPAHFREGPWSIAFGRESLRSIMSADGDKPTAMICGNDLIAFGVITEARAMGLDVPGHLSVTGFNDDEIARHCEPGITTVRVDNAAIGERSAHYLLRRLAGETPPPEGAVSATVITRGSVAAPPERSAPRIYG